MFDPEVYNRIIECEYGIVSARQKLKVCRDEEMVRALKADIRMYEYRIKSEKMDMSKEDIKLYRQRAREEGFRLKLFPKLSFTEQEEMEARHAQEWLETPLEELFPGITEYLEEHGDPSFR